MRILLLSFLLFGFSTAYGQLSPFGAQQIFGAISTLGTEVVRAVEYKKTKAELAKREEEYDNTLAQADALFDAGKFREARDSYNNALRFKQEQLVLDQVARCNAEIARVERGEYELLIEKADSLYAQWNYPAASESYTAALKQSDQQYPKDKLAQIKADQERLQKVQFSGLLIADTRKDDFSSRAYSKDPYSDFIHPGKYTSIDNLLVYSNYQTLDGIAVPANKRLVIYSEPNFKGTILLDVTGPAIINNVTKKSNPDSAEIQTRDFDQPIQERFPQSVRTWSVSDMNSWVKGSMEIIIL